MSRSSQPEQYPFFVYGTLRRGGHYHPLFRRISRGDVQVTPSRLMGFKLHCNHQGFHIGLPYVGVGSQNDMVVGDLIEVPGRYYGQVLRALDGLESYRPHLPFNHYIRVALAVTSGRTFVPAWVYLGGPGFPFNEEVEDGDYIALVTRQEEARRAAMDELARQREAEEDALATGG